MTERIRPLSPIERTVWRLNAGSSLNFTTIARVRGDLSMEAIRRGVRFIQARHPHLRKGIDGTDWSRPWFVSCDAEIVPECHADADWVGIVEGELTRPFDEAGPLARVIWLPTNSGGRLLLTLHHAISDGKSGVFAMRDLLAGSTGLAESMGLEQLPEPPRVDDVLAPLARGLRGWLGLARFVARESVDDFRIGKPCEPRYDETPRCSERMTMVVPREFAPDFVSRLAARARSERTSVHGILLAAMSFAIAEDRADDESIVYVGSPIDLRPSLEPPVGEDVGYYVSFLPFRRRIERSDDIWQVARELKQSLVAGRAARREHVAARAMQVVEKMIRGDSLTPTEFVHAWEDTVQSTSGLTNLGRLDVPTSFGDLELEAMHFAVGASALSAQVATATSTGGRLNWNLEFTSPTFTRAHALALADRMVALVDAAVGPAP